MAHETVHTTHSKQPGKQELKEEVKVETKDGVKVESTYEVKEEVKQGTPESNPNSRIGRAEAVIKKNVVWALGAGIVPIPVVDFVAIASVQLKMLNELSDIYGVQFSSSLAKKIVSSLLAAVGSIGVGGAIGASLAKMIPVIGPTLGYVSVPAFAGAFTNATGKVFLMHFESGGTLLDFNPHAMRAHFKHEFEKSKETVARTQEEKKGAVVKLP